MDVGPTEASPPQPENPPSTKQEEEPKPEDVVTEQPTATVTDAPPPETAQVIMFPVTVAIDAVWWLDGRGEGIPLISPAAD